MHRHESNHQFAGMGTREWLDRQLDTGNEALQTALEEAERIALVLLRSINLGTTSFLAAANLEGLNTTLMTQLNRWEILAAKLRQTRQVSQVCIAERTYLVRKSPDAHTVWI